jgi:aminopeptidase-like protein
MMQTGEVHVHSPSVRAPWRELLDSLGPLNRVHNGPEFSQALRIIERYIQDRGFDGQARIVSFEAGTEINTWLVPKRWTVRKFQIHAPSGRDIAGSHPLSLTPFSCSFRGRLTREELLAKAHSRADLPDSIPFVFRRMYRHWDADWGIALPKAEADSLEQGMYDVCIETEFSNEPMEMIEYRSHSQSDRVIQLVAHLDHPGQYNDSLSGVVGALEAVREIERRLPNRSFGFSVLACPEIVGSSVYLATQPVARQIDYAMAPNMLGHDAPLALCLTKNEGTQIDLAMHLALLAQGSTHVVGEWHKYPDCGDEISYDAPGLDIPSATLSRVGQMFPYYHSSFDTSEQVDTRRFEESVAVMAEALTYLDRNAVPVAMFKGLPSLANPRLDLYLEPQNLNNMVNPNAEFGVINFRTGKPLELRLFQEFFIANISGYASLLDIAYGYGAPFDLVASYAEAFAAKGLIELQRGPITEKTYDRRIVRTANVRHKMASDGSTIASRTGARL